jgi:flagellar protein FlaF
MAVAEIIGAAVGVLLLVVVAYLLVGGTLSTAEIVVTAQKDLTAITDARLRTSLTISGVSANATNHGIDIVAVNTGNEPIHDLLHLDAYSFNNSKVYTHYTYDATNTGTATGTWSVLNFQDDEIHRKQFDPGVTMTITIVYPGEEYPSDVLLVTSNGVSAAANT